MIILLRQGGFALVGLAMGLSVLLAQAADREF